MDPSAWAALHNKSHTLYIKYDEVVIGRLLLNLRDPHLSQKHCVIRRTDSNTFTICDYSVFGTYVNGKRLQRDIPVYLNTSDRVSIMNRYFYTFNINKKRWQFERELKRKLYDSEDGLPVQKKDTETFDKENQERNNQVQKKVKKIKRTLEEHKRLKSGMENLEAGLLCNVCKEIYINPYVLNCHHSFCKVCIVEWRKQKNACPVCRKDIITCTKTFIYNGFIALYEELIKQRNDKDAEQSAVAAIKSTPLQELSQPGPSGLTQPTRWQFERELKRKLYDSEDGLPVQKKDTKTFGKESQEKNKQVQEKVKEMKKTLEDHKKLKSGLEKMELGLLCNICKEVYVNPYVLNCHHSFCKLCLDEYREEKNFCPVCSKYIEIPTKAFFYDGFIAFYEELINETNDKDAEQSAVAAIKSTPLRELPQPGPSGLTQPTRRDQFEWNQLAGPSSSRTQPSTSTPLESRLLPRLPREIIDLTNHETPPPVSVTGTIDLTTP